MAKFAPGSNNDSSSISDPLIRPRRKLQLLEFFDGEGETPSPRPIGQVEIELCVRLDYFWELGMDMD